MNHRKRQSLANYSDEQLFGLLLTELTHLSDHVRYSHSGPERERKARQAALYAQELRRRSLQITLFPASSLRGSGQR